MRVQRTVARISGREAAVTDEKRQTFRVVIELEAPTDTLAVEAGGGTVEYGGAQGVLVVGARVEQPGGPPLEVRGAPLLEPGTRRRGEEACLSRWGTRRPTTRSEER